MEDHKYWSRDELVSLAKQGVAAVRQGSYDALRFNVFNKDEADVVNAWMQANATDVPYQITRVC